MGQALSDTNKSACIQTGKKHIENSIHIISELLNKQSELLPVNSFTNESSEFRKLCNDGDRLVLYFIQTHTTLQKASSLLANSRFQQNIEQCRLEAKRLMTELLFLYTIWQSIFEYSSYSVYQQNLERVTETSEFKEDSFLSDMDRNMIIDNLIWPILDHLVKLTREEEHCMKLFEVWLSLWNDELLRGSSANLLVSVRQREHVLQVTETESKVDDNSEPVLYTNTTTSTDKFGHRLSVRGVLFLILHFLHYWERETKNWTIDICKVINIACDSLIKMQSKLSPTVTPASLTTVPTTLSEIWKDQILYSMSKIYLESDENEDNPPSYSESEQVEEETREEKTDYEWFQFLLENALFTSTEYEENVIERIELEMKQHKITLQSARNELAQVASLQKDLPKNKLSTKSSMLERYQIQKLHEKLAQQNMKLVTKQITQTSTNSPILSLSSEIHVLSVLREFTVYYDNLDTLRFWIDRLSGFYIETLSVKDCNISNVRKEYPIEDMKSIAVDFTKAFTNVSTLKLKGCNWFLYVKVWDRWQCLELSDIPEWEEIFSSEIADDANDKIIQDMVTNIATCKTIVLDRLPDNFLKWLPLTKYWDRLDVMDSIFVNEEKMNIVRDDIAEEEESNGPETNETNENPTTNVEEGASETSSTYSADDRIAIPKSLLRPTEWELEELDYVKSTGLMRAFALRSADIRSSPNFNQMDSKAKSVSISNSHNIEYLFLMHSNFPVEEMYFCTASVLHIQILLSQANRFEHLHVKYYKKRGSGRGGKALKCEVDRIIDEMRWKVEVKNLKTLLFNSTSVDVNDTEAIMRTLRNMLLV